MFYTVTPIQQIKSPPTHNTQTPKPTLAQRRGVFASYLRALAEIVYKTTFFFSH
jgi:hypothetical protein